MVTDREAYLQTAEARMHELDDEIETLRREARAADGDDAADYRDKVDDLERRKAEIAERYERLAAAGADDFGSHRDAFDDAWDRLSASFRIHR